MNPIRTLYNDFARKVRKVTARGSSNGAASPLAPEAPSPMTKHVSPEKRTVQSEPTVLESGREPEPASSYGTEKKLVELVEARVQEAKPRRASAEADWAVCVPMMESRQWLTYDDTEQVCKSLLASDPAERRKYIHHNLIRVLVFKLVALATTTKPDATAAPGSQAPLDVAAAAEANAITAHLWRKYKRPSQTLALVMWAIVCGVAYLDESWDAAANADIIAPRPDGTVGKASAPVGEVSSLLIAPFEVYVDPRATRFDSARWIIRESQLELATIHERFGVQLEPDSGATTSFFDARAAFGFGSRGTGTGSNKNATRMATVRMMYERPTPRYPEGRTIVTGGGRLIYAGTMPLADRQRFPLARLAYDEAAEHPYGIGLVRDLAPLQIEINRLLTKATNQIEASKDTLLRTKGDGAGADAYADDEDTDGITEHRTYRTVHHLPGMPPIWQQAPPVTSDVWRMIDLAWMHMQHIAGIHDINMGGTPTGVTAGISIELLQQGDRSQISLFTQRIEQFAVDRDTIDIALYAQHAAPYLQRLMGLDTSGNPQVAQFRAMAFQALTAGGSVEVIVTPGSATPKTPAAQKNDILQYYQMGLLDPANIAAEVAIRLLPDAASTQILEAREQVKAKVQQEQRQQAQMQMQLQAANQPQTIPTSSNPAPPI